MNGFLIDTNVLSEYNKPNGPDIGVKQWLEGTPRDLQHISVITLAEIQKGIELLVPGKRKAQLEQWFQQELETWFSGRILHVDRQVGNPLGRVAGQEHKGRQTPSDHRLVDCCYSACT